jgi:hypothetical protein
LIKKFIIKNIIKIILATLLSLGLFHSNAQNKTGCENECDRNYLREMRDCKTDLTFQIFGTVIGVIIIEVGSGGTATPAVAEGVVLAASAMEVSLLNCTTKAKDHHKDCMEDCYNKGEGGKNKFGYASIDGWPWWGGDVESWNPSGNCFDNPCLCYPTWCETLSGTGGGGSFTWCDIPASITGNGYIDMCGNFHFWQFMAS